MGLVAEEAARLGLVPDTGVGILGCYVPDFGVGDDLLEQVQTLRHGRHGDQRRGSLDGGHIVDRRGQYHRELLLFGQSVQVRQFRQLETFIDGVYNPCGLFHLVCQIVGGVDGI